jgi:hypothetical protein
VLQFEIEALWPPLKYVLLARTAKENVINRCHDAATANGEYIK